MLIIKAEIMFFDPSENLSNNDGICAKNILRPAFNFGEGLLFSGTIESDGATKKYLYQKMYVVELNFQQ